MRRLRAICSRIHIPLGHSMELFTVVAVVAAMALASALCAGEADAAETPSIPKMLLIADDGKWQTVAIGTNSTSAPVTVVLRELGCGDGVGTTLTIPAGGAAALQSHDKLGLRRFCSQYALVEAPPNSSAILHFSDGKSTSDFTMRPTGAVAVGQPYTSSVDQPIINNSVISTLITGKTAEPSAITVEVVGTYAGQPVTSVETIDLPAGIFQVRPLAVVDVGYIKVSLGYSQFGLYRGLRPVYGFISLGSSSTVYSW